ncbi:MAG: BTAD domain-containing putative transcriptional regulator, partial [Aestuariivirga sp.]
ILFEKLTAVETGQANIDAAKRLVGLDPLREASHRALMRGFAAAGETALALQQYEACRAILKTEFGVEPAAETFLLRSEIIQRKIVLVNADPAIVEPESDFSLPSADKPSIAVLPFTNLSGDPAKDYFSDGITEDINTELARYHSLTVAARNASFQFRGPGVDVAAVRRVLGVRYIVDGSIRKAGTNVRVSARLTDAESGKQLWAERYDRAIEEVFEIQDEVVQTIVSTLEGRLAAAGAARVRAKPTASWVAYDYFLQGRELSNRYKIHEADGFLARAIELDPGYVHAYAWRASALLAKYWYDQKPETFQQAVTCAEKALSLDDSDAWCHQAMGLISLHSNKLALAGMHFERAMGLNPNDVNVTADYAGWLGYMGRFDEALRYLDMAMQRDPFPPNWMWEIRGTVLLLSKRHEEAIGAFHKAPIENFFTHALLAAAYAWAGQMENARRELFLARQGREDTLFSLMAGLPCSDDDHRNHILDGLRMAGLPGQFPNREDDKPSIAVLPFVNLGNDPEQQYSPMG